MIAWVLLGAVGVQRLAELAWARHNTQRLLDAGAVEIGAAHYPLIVLLHASWLLTIVVSLPSPPVIYLVPLVGYLAAEGARIWVLTSLGPYFTTRIITLPNAPLVRRGPYRLMRHPNYAVVVAEFALLPLALGEPGVAVVFSLLNAAMLTWRIRTENQALLARR